MAPLWKPEEAAFAADSAAVDSAAATDNRGYVHLYVRSGMQAELLPMVCECPAVLARISVCKGSTFDVAALHMVPGPTGKEARKKQFLSALSGLRPGSQLILGDMNVRPDELQELTSIGQFHDAEYVGKSWHPAKSGYEASEGFQQGGLAFSFDRIFFSGALCVEAFLVGQGRVFSEGVNFSLSDHCAVLGVLDLHASHKTGSQGSEVRRERRGALAKVRDHACLEEQCLISAMNRDGRQASAQQRATVDAKQQAAVVRAQRAQVKERKVHFDGLWESAFGAHSLFRVSPLVLRTLCIPIRPTKSLFQLLGRFRKRGADSCTGCGHMPFGCARGRCPTAWSFAICSTWGCSQRSGTGVPPNSEGGHMVAQSCL